MFVDSGADSYVPLIMMAQVTPRWKVIGWNHTVDGSETPNNHLGCIKEPVNNEILLMAEILYLTIYRVYTSQVVQDFSHQQ